MEFSKTVKFDFPRIPILGTLLLIITLMNYNDFILPFILDEKGKLSISVITAGILALGTAGISISHLISMLMFDLLFPIKKYFFRKQDQNYRASYQWFESIQEHAKPQIRASERGGEHYINNRLSIDKLNHKQVHATLHALEIECREKSPAFGVQLEYYYSMYIFFFMSSIFASLMLISGLYHLYVLDTVFIPYSMMFLDGVIVVVCMIGTVRSRKIKEHLRITLFNHDRELVVELLSKWYQCELK
ncbi:hypothetical protein [Colwellia sp. E150_009]